MTYIIREIIFTCIKEKCVYIPKLLNLFRTGLSLVIFKNVVHFATVDFEPNRAGKGKNEKCTLWRNKKQREKRARGKDR